MFLRRSWMLFRYPTSKVLATEGHGRFLQNQLWGFGLPRQMASRTAQRNRQLFFLNNSECRGRLRQGRNFMYWLFDLNLHIWISIFFCSLFCFSIRFFLYQSFSKIRFMGILENYPANLLTYSFTFFNLV